MKVIFAFFASLGISFGSLFGYLMATDPQKPAVLSSQVEASPTQTPEVSVLSLTTAAPTETPTLSPSPTPSPKPSPTKTPSPRPTSTPTRSPSASPTPTRTPTPTPTRSPSSSPTPTTSPSASPTPTSISTVSAPAAYEPFFVQYSAQYSVDKNIMEKIADCESHFNPNAVNGDYLGMFQFASQTWVSKRGLMGFDTNPSLRTNAEESIRTAAFTIHNNGTGPWANCI